ncbi:glutamine synthetase III [Pseudobutyrivibrio xylanivorans]|uniref:Glutamine synthetase type III n=1 Tax=Pseudobutyrivibrio xylanivorans TaxID=185007 RepID=A0A5P6VSS0_PSEXY|nr:glutamine synthetase III [Pseudobutyrivibrio xylanivorans]QFJ55348.1 glutamine synthetase type III [Pseudobutyrivibrio xylanivorans]
MEKKVTEIFGSKVFNDATMKERLPKDAYKALRNTVEEGRPLDRDLANVIAHAMKEWAIELGATHFTHWFQPMTGVTAEKHDSFIQPDEGGKVIMTFSGKELIKGEPDASSFPSGGLRATFEARGYTAWDPTSYVFIKDDTLCIPTAFCSYSGEALDKKTPLLRSMEALDKQAVRVLKLFGHDDVKRVITTVGPEQEYFLIDEEVYNKRPDLIYTGRTLFGAKPPKGQELEDHYFGTIKPRVSAFMKELDEELWKLGVLAKTKHNEVAPAQHELAPVFSTTNIATDHNQLTMEMMKVVAKRHGMVCLLHEKPFAGVNGSGKHNNWSISTDTGVNLLEPGATPSQNTQFLLFLTAVIKAVDDYQELLRVSVASAGNDHRLGANEAPPAIISMFIGDELEAIVESIIDGTDYHDIKKKKMTIGATVVPSISQDTTDRNRTSPFAFTGNKFEFRSLGSSASISGPNVILNTIVAEVLDQFAAELEGSKDFDKDVDALIKRELTAHKRIIFNGNGYAPEWVEEAKKRGLANLKSTVDALPAFVEKKSIDVFTKHGVFTEQEIFSRYDIQLENYYKVLDIEALTLDSMVKKDIMAAATDYQYTLAETLNAKAATGLSVDSTVEKKRLECASKLTCKMDERLEKLEADIEKAKELSDTYELAKFHHDVIFADMNEVREVVDLLETVVPSDIWPYPTYGEILYSVK